MLKCNSIEYHCPTPQKTSIETHVYVIINLLLMYISIYQNIIITFSADFLNLPHIAKPTTSNQIEYPKNNEDLYKTQQSRI